MPALEHHTPFRHLPSLQGNLRRPHVPDAGAGPASQGSPRPGRARPTHPPASPRRARCPLTLAAGGQRISPWEARAAGPAGRGARRRRGQGARGRGRTRSSPCAPRPPASLASQRARAPAGRAGPAQRRAGWGRASRAWRAPGGASSGRRGRRRCGGPAAEWWDAIYWLQFPAPLDGMETGRPGEAGGGQAGGRRGRREPRRRGGAQAGAGGREGGERPGWRRRAAAARRAGAGWGAGGCLPAPLHPRQFPQAPAPRVGVTLHRSTSPDLPFRLIPHPLKRPPPGLTPPLHPFRLLSGLLHLHAPRRITHHHHRWRSETLARGLKPAKAML